MDIEIDGKGPVFDARGPQILQDASDELGRATALAGVGAVRTELDRVLQHPTGRYRASIHQVQDGPGNAVVDDKQVYGPWLAGEGSRNRSTRFKGYTHWRRATQQLDRQVPTIADRVLPTHVRRLEG